MVPVAAEEVQAVTDSEWIDAIAALKAERLDIGAQKATPLDRCFHEQALRGAARQGFEPDRAGAREAIEHARAIERFRIGMAQDVEQALARPVRGRADVLALRRGKPLLALAAKFMGLL